MSITTAATFTTPIVLSGTLGTPYKFWFKVNAFCPLTNFTGGTQFAPYVIRNGTYNDPLNTNPQIYLEDPFTTYKYYLNHYKSNQRQLVRLDYWFLVELRGGQTVNLVWDTVDTDEVQEPEVPYLTLRYRYLDMDLATYEHDNGTNRFKFVGYSEGRAPASGERN